MRAPRAVPPPVLVVLVLFSSALAGCLGHEGGNDPPDGDGDGETPPGDWLHPDYQVVLTDPLDATDCLATELLLEAPREHVQNLLPEGFSPGPSPVSGDNAALTIELRACARATGEDDAPLASATLLAIVEAPPVPPSLHEYDAGNRSDPGAAGQALDLYALATYTDGDRLAQLLRQSGVPHATAELHLSAAEAVALVVAEATLRADGDDSETLRAVATAATIDAFTEHRRVWRASPRGLQLFEELHHRDGGDAGRAFGTATCLLPSDALFAPLLPAEACLPAAARTTPAFDAAGRSYWFHGARLR